MGTGAIPKPNVPGENQYIASPKQPTYVREDVVRIDHNITDKLHLLGSYIHDQMSQTEYPDQWGSDTYTTVGEVFANPSWASVVKLSQTLSPTLLNETCSQRQRQHHQHHQRRHLCRARRLERGQLLHRQQRRQPPPAGAVPGRPAHHHLGTNYCPWHNSYLNYQLRDDLSWIKGKHAFKFGFSYMRADKNQQLQADTQGDYTFNNTTASQDAYVNFLLGFANTYQQLQTMSTDHWINNNYSFYCQDDWHVTSRLTLNIGVRYDALPHVYEKNNQVADFNPADFNPANAQTPNASTGNLNPAGPGFAQPAGAPAPFYLNGIEMAGVNGAPRGLVKNDYFTFQPRLGFAYDLFGNGKTVIRGGAGIFYERVQGNDTYNVNTTPPFAYQPSANQVFFSNPNQSYASRRHSYLARRTGQSDHPQQLLPQPGNLPVQLRRAARTGSLRCAGRAVRRHLGLEPERHARDQRSAPVRAGRARGRCNRRRQQHQRQLQPLPYLSGLRQHQAGGERHQLQLQLAAGRAPYGEKAWLDPPARLHLVA